VETLGSRFGSCACGGALEEHVVAITARRTGRRKGVPLLEVEQGVCPICGSRVYKPWTLQSAEAAFRSLQLSP
jgi:rRNA maturation endonuclease Nob1